MTYLTHTPREYFSYAKNLPQKQTTIIHVALKLCNMKLETMLGSP